MVEIPRIENIIEKYSPIFFDYEWRIRFGEKEYICEPLFRHNPEYNDEIMCWPAHMDYKTAKFHNAVRYMRWEEFLAWLPQHIDRIVVERDGEPLHYFYHVKNISERKSRL